MSAGDVELIREGMGEFARTRRVPHELLHPDVEWRTLMQTHHGRAGVDEWCEEIERTFPQFRADIQELVDAGEGRVVSAMRFEGLHGGSGIDASMSFAALWELEGGRVTRVRAFGTTDEALRAVGAG